jgi:putative flippase GtrA
MLFIKYLFASFLALIVDYACYFLLVKFELLPIPTAAVVGYLSGLVIAYFMMANKVFQKGWLRYKKFTEGILFLLSGGFGAALTYSTVQIAVSFINPDPHIAKILAIGVSFFGVFLFRKYIVFKVSKTSLTT